MAKGLSSIHPTLVDAASLFDACDAIAERVGRTKITLDYAKLSSCLDQIRAIHGWESASPKTILLSIDPNSEGQQRFQAMLKHSGFELDVVHYRDTFVSLPPGRGPSEMTSKPVVSLAPRIAYIAGLMAGYQRPQLLVVSHSFELHGPLTDLARRIQVKNGKIGLAYFGSLLDFRWKAAGLFESGKVDPQPSFVRGHVDDSPDPPSKKEGLKFFDLDPFCKELLGVDFAGSSNAPVVARDGLSRF